MPTRPTCMHASPIIAAFPQQAPLALADANPSHMLVPPALKPQDSDDITYMIGALKALGVQLEQLPDGDMVVHGCGGRFAVQGAELYLGNAGTAMRPLTAAVVAAGRGK